MVILRISLGLQLRIFKFQHYHSLSVYILYNNLSFSLYHAIIFSVFMVIMLKLEGWSVSHMKLLYVLILTLAFSTDFTSNINSIFYYTFDDIVKRVSYYILLFRGVYSLPIFAITASLLSIDNEIVICNLSRPF